MTASRPPRARNRRSAVTRGPDRLNGSTRPSCLAIQTGEALTRPLKTSETVARDIVHDIITDGLQPGDGLPSEGVMLQHYSVSRESLREALRLLEVQGLISIRRGPGGGPVVGTVDPANLGRVSTLYFHLAGATYRELFEAWVLTETLMAQRAARNPDAGARAAAMAPYTGDDPSGSADEVAQFVQAHSAFHSVVASLAQNRVLELVFPTMGHIVAHHSAVTDDPRALRKQLEEDHRAIARAIVAGHAKRAGELMESHVGSVAKFNAKRMGSRVDDFIEWR